jgi:acetyl esterase/lipase
MPALCFFVVAGDSAGGNLAAAASLALTAEADDARRDAAADATLPLPPRPRAVVLFYPALDAADERPSYEAYANGYGLSRADMRAFWAHYLDAGADATDDDASAAARRADARASPLCAPRAALAAQPHTHIVTAECDVLRDEGEAYADALRDAKTGAASAAGIVTLMRYPGVLHGFMATGHALPCSEAALLEAASVLRAALGVDAEGEGHVGWGMWLRQAAWRARTRAHRARVCALLRVAAMLPARRPRL